MNETTTKFAMCPGQDPIWHDVIKDFERTGFAGVAATWAERLCKAGLYHHGAKTVIGTFEEGRPLVEEWSCWNCDFRVVRSTTLINAGTAGGRQGECRSCYG